jgi:hypothetical protein
LFPFGLPPLRPLILAASDLAVDLMLPSSAAIALRLGLKSVLHLGHFMRSRVEYGSVWQFRLRGLCARARSMSGKLPNSAHLDCRFSKALAACLLRCDAVVNTMTFAREEATLPRPQYRSNHSIQVLFSLF